MKMLNKELDAKIIGDDLCRLANIIWDAGICTDIGPLTSAGNSCSKNATKDEWSYRFDFLEFNISSQAGCIPAECEDLKLRFSIDIKGIIQDDPKLIKNPLKNLKFDLELIGTGYDFVNNNILQLHSSWHLDKHIRAAKDNKPKYSHPEYHLAFGGSKMEAKNDLYGSSLILPTPRLAYPPMDAALGINFILQNYYQKDKIAPILDNTDYKSIISNSERMLIEPYAKSMLSNWCNLDCKFEDYFDGNSIFPLAM